MNIKKFISVVFISLIAVGLFAEEEKKWVIAAEKFSYSRGQVQNSITDATAESMPVEILEKLGNTLTRVILPDESLERTIYNSRKERISLYLQLSSEYKKRDAVFLNNYSDSELKSKINEEEKKIKEIQEKIDLNLKALKEAESKAEKKEKQLQKGDFIQNEKNPGEWRKFSNLFRNLVVKDGNLVSSEDIGFYKDDTATLYSASDKAKKAGYNSYAFEKEIISASVNTLITGVITNYGQYMSVTVTAYSYPGGKVIGTITEIGSMQEKEMLTTSIARQLIPVLTNAMPVVINFKFNPKNADVHLYIDDAIQTEIPENMVIDSGIHNIQIVSDEYETIGTNYFFTGNERFEIEINLAPKKDGYIQVGLLKPMIIDGEIYSNGLVGEKIDSRKTKIKINGQSIMGEFINENGMTDFYFIPEKLIFDGSNVVIKPKPIDRSEYIEKRRKWMYGAYSALITSLVPSFYTYGNYYNTAMMYNNEMGDLETAQKWQKAYRISSITTIACGSFFVFEMFRYFRAANSVLPKKAKPAKPRHEKIFAVQNPENSDENTVITESENKETDSEGKSSVIITDKTDKTDKTTEEKADESN